MRVSLQDAQVGRDNNFNLIRVLAACAVIASHSFAVLGQSEPWVIWIGTSPGGLAVDIFFVVSGFLVCKSLMSRGDVRGFLIARALRIFPALIVNVLILGLVVGAAISELSLADYYTDPRLMKFIFHNLQMVLLPYPAGELPGTMFDNGPLWSLPVEICCYVLLLAIWLITSQARARYPALVQMAVLAASGFALYRYTQSAGVHLACMFSSGCLYYVFRRKVTLSERAALYAVAAVTVSACFGRYFTPVICLAGPYLVLCAAFLVPGKLRLYNKLGDYSYGTYIYGYPVQACLALGGGFAGPWALTAASVPITLTVAALSWHFVERPALKWNIPTHLAPNLQTS